MSYIYHLIPEPFEGDELIPLNCMDNRSEIYKKNVKKYEGREELRRQIIPTLNCLWNDVVQFSSISPELIFKGISNIKKETQLKRRRYYKIHKDQILNHYEAVIFYRKVNKGQWLITVDEVLSFNESYEELKTIPSETINYWKKAQLEGNPLLWFNHIPHIMVKGKIAIKDLEVCELKL
jgi:hypothetical protein